MIIMKMISELIDHEHVEGQSPAVILDGIRFHKDPACNQIVFKEAGSHPIEHMIPGIQDIINDLDLKGKHAVDVHIPGSGDQVKFVVVLTRERVGYEVAPVIKILVLYKIVISYRVPPGRLDHADFPAFFSRHKLTSKAGHVRTASAQSV